MACKELEKLSGTSCLLLLALFFAAVKRHLQKVTWESCDLWLFQPMWILCHMTVWKGSVPLPM